MGNSRERGGERKGHGNFDVYITARTHSHDVVDPLSELGVDVVVG